MTTLRGGWKTTTKKVMDNYWIRNALMTLRYTTLTNHCQWDQKSVTIRALPWKCTWMELHSPGHHIMHWRVRKKKRCFKIILLVAAYTATCSRGWALRDLSRCRPGVSQTLICALIIMDFTKLQILTQLLCGVGVAVRSGPVFLALSGDSNTTGAHGPHFEE